MKSFSIMVFIYMALLLSFKAYSYSSSQGLKQFETDYCTGFPEGTFFQPNLWKSCCFDHDLRYWFGGSKNEEKKADLILKQCVAKKAGSFYSNIMYYAVRTGHYSPIKHRLKWGWGHTSRSPYKNLSGEEKSHILDELSKLNLDSQYLETFISIYNLK
jgi:hypothetical protein